jgi:hypothetical protein
MYNKTKTLSSFNNFIFIIALVVILIALSCMLYTNCTLGVYN